MKVLLLAFYFVPISLFTQESNLTHDQRVTGILNSSGRVYLVLGKGFIAVSETDIYTEYYRKIYGDSTLVNPNTVLNSEFDLNIIPYIFPDQINQRFDFDEPLDIGLFIQMNETGKLNLTSYGSGILDSLGIR